MNHFSEMEWNSKWDWENIVGFGSKSIESPKKLQLAEWMIVDDGEIHTGSFNLSGGGGTCGSDGGHISSAKSCITDSSTKERFRAFEGSSGNFNKKIGMEGSEVSVEPLIGLRLGKRTYFENGGGGGNAKKTQCKSSSQNANTPCCQVQGCNTDLSMAKEYHRKHRVCDTHSKCSKVVVGGLERRFCQQCSRFHSLSEFDEKKRSCRRRLSDHNARRRKPRQFNSSPLYGGAQQMSFLLNGSSKFTLTTGGVGYSSKSNGDGGGTAINMPCSISEVLSPGSKGSMISAAPEYNSSRALSLLSNNNSSWDSCHAPIPQASSEFWSTSTNPEIQLFKTPYEGDFYSNMLN